MDKYYDIYEITRTDREDTEHFTGTEVVESEETESLKYFKTGLAKLHVMRKLFLCGLLALEADGGKTDFARWPAAVETMQTLSSETFTVVATIDMNMQEDGEQSLCDSRLRRGLIGDSALPIMPSPELPLTPRRARMRTRKNKLSSLSRGVRGLQAKMHLLRDDSDKALDDSHETSRNWHSIATQYESIGEDLRILLEEWEQGRESFVSASDKSENRYSTSSVAGCAPLSPTLSIGGSTAVEGSPPNALRAINGLSSYRSRSSTGTSASGEEVFEVVAIPRQRSMMTREERIAKMKEDRVRQLITKGKAEANTHMLKELEMVIKLRPRGRTTGRILSV